MKYQMNHRSLMSKALMPATPSAMNEDVVQNYSWNHHIARTRSKFPDYSLTFHNSFNFPWPITKFPDNSLTFAWYGISLNFPWPLDTLKILFWHDLGRSFHIWGQIEAVFDISKFLKWPPFWARLTTNFLPKVIPEVEYSRKIAIRISDILSVWSTL